MDVNHFSRTQRGLTLIELVIVLAVLGTLAAIAVPQLTGLQEEADLAGTATTVSSEATNLFAKDLANGNATSGWANQGNVCAYVLSNAASISSGGYGLADSKPGSGSFRAVSVPIYSSNNDRVESTQCYLTAQ